MDNGDGFDVLEFMQANPGWSIVPRIVYSSSDEDDDVRTAFLLGASAYHVKPAQTGNSEKLLREIVEYWAKSQVPPVDENGRLLTTRSMTRKGGRYPLPKAWQFDEAADSWPSR